MGYVVNGVVVVNGMAIGSVSQLKNELKDGTVLDLEYDRPRMIVIS